MNADMQTRNVKLRAGSLLGGFLAGGSFCRWWEIFFGEAADEVDAAVGAVEAKDALIDVELFGEDPASIHVEADSTLFHLLGELNLQQRIVDGRENLRGDGEGGDAAGDFFERVV
jgi:hypothetical protein